VSTVDDAGLARGRQSGPAATFLAGGGEMGERIRSADWSATPLGVPETWPQSLRSTISMLLPSKAQIVLFWGEDFTVLYNDAYRPVFGAKHPRALGLPGREAWSEIWDGMLHDLLASVVRTGEAFWAKDLLFKLERYGFAEETYFDVSYDPVRVESGAVGGVFCIVTETTERVIGGRRMSLLKDLAARNATARTLQEACRLATDTLAVRPQDVTFALTYLDGELQSLTPDADGQLARTPDALVRRLPVSSGAGGRPGQLVVGLSPQRPFDDGYHGFLELVADQLSAALSNARAYEEERRRAEALAELDRAKTVFFSNVSHEFRTPLTLMLGPIEEILADADLSPGHREALTLTHRNGLRLRKLVNTLLDFSRIEAGRVDAAYEPVDLAAFTAELASVFRAAVDKAGLRYVVDCQDVGEPVYVDREMWEKVVLNLISNAFKFTLEGEIGITVHRDGSCATVEVHDTGSGIPATELPNIFERFHRVEGTQGRTHEGTGIGLALVQELVKLHGGSVVIDSGMGAGTRVRVSLPLGRAHLPPERIAPSRSAASTTVGAGAFVEEALRWLPDAPVEAAPPDRDDRCILVADDNADMRAYLRRLLGGRWRVEAVGDGQEALAALRRRPADLLIADVMMPKMDGFALLREMRASAMLRDVPVLMLSARAGDESRLEGLRAGADDFLAKPFSARELTTRVEAQLLRAHVRAIEESHARRLTTILRHAPVAVAILRGAQHVFEFANDSYLELSGRATVIGRTFQEVFPELEGQGMYELLDSVHSSGQPYIADSRGVQMRRRGAEALEELHFNFVYQPMPGPSGTVDGIAVVATDVTELANARRAAETASRAKDEFMAMLGHELRNPLAPILTALQLMSLRDGAELTVKERAVIDRQVRHLMRLVDDLLDVSRIARGKIDLSLDQVEIARVVTQAVEMASPLLEERRHNLVLRVPRDGLVVNGDVVRLSQVVQNLLTNAAKYTEPGGQIEVEARLVDRSIELSVRDDGVGIPPDLLPVVFDLFVQDRQTKDRSQGGLGLGLTLVRTLVGQHGGTVEARSAGVGQGSQFIVRLPASLRSEGATPRRAAAQPRRANDKHLRALVVDDNVDAASMLADALAASGYDAHVASDGPAALQIATALRPNVVLLDLGLPVMDGYEVADRIRASGVPALIIAVTGYGQDADRARSEAAGFAAHFVKPVDLDELKRCLDRLVVAVDRAR
jgi:PAS domain S-box-containing protein